jgi:hypothetical protein
MVGGRRSTWEAFSSPIMEPLRGPGAGGPDGSTWFRPLSRELELEGPTQLAGGGGGGGGMT